jgi:hypothetical protein
MVRIKVGPIGPVSTHADDVEPREQRRNAPGTDVLDRNLMQESRNGSLTPLPTIADREETQCYHDEGNKDENPNEAKPK